MDEGTPEVSGVLVVSAWMEKAAPSTFRARLTGTVKPSNRQTTTVASTPQQVCEAVLAWLTAITEA